MINKFTCFGGVSKTNIYVCFFEKLSLTQTNKVYNIMSHCLFTSEMKENHTHTQTQLHFKREGMATCKEILLVIYNIGQQMSEVS